MVCGCLTHLALGGSGDDVPLWFRVEALSGAPEKGRQLVDKLALLPTHHLKLVDAAH